MPLKIVASPVRGGLLSLKAPRNIVAPVATGDGGIFGNNLSVAPGTWAAAPTPTFTYQWKRSDTNANLPGASTGSTYTPQVADWYVLAGLSVYCTVTATNAVGNASTNSNAVTITTPSTPQYVAEGAELESNSNGAFAPALPAGVVAGDILFLIIVGTDEFNQPNGWVNLGVAASGYSQVLWKRAAAGETATSFTKIGFGSVSGRIIAIRYAKRTGAPVLPTNFNVSNVGNSAIFSTPSVAVDEINTMGLFIAAGIGTNNTSNFAINTGGNGTGLTTRYTDTFTTGRVTVATNMRAASTGGIGGAGNSTNLTITNAVDAWTLLVQHIHSAQAPVNISPPAASALGFVTSDGMFCAPGSWYAEPGEPADITFTYQWKLASDNSNIAGATTATWTPSSSLANTNVYCAVTATNTVGSTTANSNTVLIPASVGVVGVGSETESSSTSFAVARPGGVAVNDILIVVLNSAGNESLSLAGWTLIDNQLSTSIYYHRVAGGDTDPTFTKSGSANATARCIAIRGAKTSGSPVNVNAKSGGQDVGWNSAVYSCPTVTTTVAGCLVLAIASGIGTTSVGNMLPQTNGNLTGKVSQYTDSYTTGRVAVGSGIKVTAGATGTTSNTTSLGNSTALNVFTIAIEPA